MTTLGRQPETRPIPLRNRAGRPSPWITAAAYAVPVCILPSALWRIGAAVHGAPHSTGAGIGATGGGGGPSLYMIGLSVASLLLGSLTIGLVRSWGEVFPRWLPVVGGRAVPAKPVTIIANTGATILTLLVVYFFFVKVNSHYHWYSRPWYATPRIGKDSVSPPPGMDVLRWYLPLLAWPPLLYLVTFDYGKRRANASAPSPTVTTTRSM